MWHVCDPSQFLVSRLTGHVPYQDFTWTVSALNRQLVLRITMLGNEMKNSAHNLTVAPVENHVWVALSESGLERLHRVIPFPKSVQHVERIHRPEDLAVPIPPSNGYTVRNGSTQVWQG